MASFEFLDLTTAVRDDVTVGGLGGDFSRQAVDVLTLDVGRNNFERSRLTGLHCLHRTLWGLI